MKITDLAKEREDNRIPFWLTQAFTEEVKMFLNYYSLAQRIELTSYFIDVTNILKGLYLEGEVVKETFDNFRQKENELALRFGSAFKPYHETDWLRFFDRDTILSDLALLDEETLIKLTKEERTVTESEFQQYMELSNDLLQMHRKNLYLYKKPDWEEERKPGKPVSDDKPVEEQDREITRIRQLLLIHFLLKAGFHIDRSNRDVADIARFIHDLLGIKLTSIQNSDIYKKYRQVPGYKKGLALIEDLRFVRSALEHLKNPETLRLVDEAIEEETIKLGAGRDKKL